MRKVDYSSCKTVQELSDTTLNGLSEVYDPDFVSYLKAFPKYLSECKTYRELGTNQGGSFGVALLNKLEYYELIDKSFKNFNPIKHIFEKYADENKITIKYHESSSLDVQTNVYTDFLLVDSVHRYKHILAELEIYSPLTKKYIMFHDTAGIPEVGMAVYAFVTNNTDWEIVEKNSVSAGFMVLKRITDE